MGTKDIVTLRQFGQSSEHSACEADNPPGFIQEPPRRLAVSVTEAAAMLGISRGLAYELVHRGELPVIQLGRRLVVPIVALERLVAAASPLTSGELDDAIEVR
jgi:excisionase family DNA binding protein